MEKSLEDVLGRQHRIMFSVLFVGLLKHWVGERLWLWLNIDKKYCTVRIVKLPLQIQPRPQLSMTGETFNLIGFEMKYMISK